jgi:hypothetical protein
MNLIRQGDNECMAASVAMVFDKRLESVNTFSLFNPYCYSFPFPVPWHQSPKVASMDEICDWAYSIFGAGLVPFPRNPGCSPTEKCSMVPVWPDGEGKFLEHLSYGPGLLEGHVEHMRGHMCAWDGKKVYDPRGYTYSFENADGYNFTATRFWLKVQGVCV